MTKVIPAELVLHYSITKRQFDDPALKDAAQNIKARVDYVEERIREQEGEDSIDDILREGANSDEIWKVVRAIGNKVQVSDGNRTSMFALNRCSESK